MNTLNLALLSATVALDVVGQVCFKLGVGHEEPGDTVPAQRRGALGFMRELVVSPWIVAGVAIYIAEFVVWFAALTRVPLNEAFPFNALAYCGVVLASRLLLREHVSARRWAGTLLIAAGVMLVLVA